MSAVCQDTRITSDQCLRHVLDSCSYCELEEVYLKAFSMEVGQGIFIMVYAFGQDMLHVL